MSQTMHLVRVLDLVGKPIGGLVADVRQRNAQGALRYPHTAGLDRIRVLRAAGERRSAAELWTYLWWEPKATGNGIDCGFSGCCDRAMVENWHILVEERA
jgi:hypothetical protein